MASKGQKRKLWTEESMAAALQSVRDGKGLRETSRLYNVPVETLRRRVTGQVEPGCKPGPATILTDEEEDRLCHYLTEMCDIGYGLTREDVQRLAFSIVERIHRKHPFKDGKAGRGWFEGFMARHSNLVQRKPQPLSYCRALRSNPETIKDFFGKLGAIYGRLNLVSKPMQIFNADETGISIVHKPGKVIAQLGRRNVYAITAAEKGKTHTVLSCASASGFVLPPMIIYPRKQKVPDRLKEGCVANTLFANSENGWINNSLYLQWFKFFLDNIPPTRPVLLIEDGHSSHVSIELIELARENGVHLLCLPAHTTHILQPLDVGVFKSFKVHFSKACHRYLCSHPGQVITTEIIASLLKEAWHQALTPVNVMSGFKKCGIHPLNPGEISDRQLAPSKAFTPAATTTVPPSPDNELFTSEQQSLYKRRFEEGYDLPDPDYLAWLKIVHPEVTSPPCSDSKSSVHGSSKATTSSTDSDVLSELLVLPKPRKPQSKHPRKPALNSKAVMVTDDKVFDELKLKEKEKEMAEEKKKLKLIEKQEKKREKDNKNKGKDPISKKKGKESYVKKHPRPETTLTSGDTNTSADSDDTVCPGCGLVCKDDPGGLWVCCDNSNCETWYCFNCSGIPDKEDIPEYYYCPSCI